MQGSNRENTVDKSENKEEELTIQIFKLYTLFDQDNYDEDNAQIRFTRNTVACLDVLYI